ncbi:MAG TPA: hypothetical protein DIW51_13435 [Rhodospirillaceae bacterium]|nr:hypothetical protein [Rhodospirillaceae bacterium]|tara:strand:+ start:38278 stop:39210 length:933 start_codon:yes stop_codon:yes gene_type:complete
MTSPRDIVIVTAANARYFPLLRQAVQSVNDAGLRDRCALAVLDLGLTDEQRDELAPLIDIRADAGWDMDFPGRDDFPPYFKAMTARPHLPKYFPGHDIYIWLDADAWVQDPQVLDIFIDAARGGRLAVVPELDRSYSSFYKRPRPYWRTQNFRAFNWSYGLRVADRLARNPILNSGVFALRADAPHWGLWHEALARALTRRRLFASRTGLWAHVSEQTALNYVVFHDKAPATFLPAYCNWFCGKAVPMWDAEAAKLVEPHAPHRPLGIVHLAGDGVQDRVFEITKMTGGRLSSRLTYDAARGLADGGARR